MLRPPHYWRDRLALWLLFRLPEVLISAPERIALAVAQVLIGVMVLTRVATGVPPLPNPMPLVALWAVTMLIAGAALLGGLLRPNRPLERLGLGMTALAGLTYFVLGTNVLVHLVFLGIGVAALLRLIVSTASRTLTDGIERGARAGED